MQFPAIVFMCIISAIAYGIVHDQITARVCVEYFTIGHPQLFQTDNPTLLASSGASQEHGGQVLFLAFHWPSWPGQADGRRFPQKT